MFSEINNRDYLEYYNACRNDDHKKVISIIKNMPIRSISLIKEINNYRKKLTAIILIGFGLAAKNNHIEIMKIIFNARKEIVTDRFILCVCKYNNIEMLNYIITNSEEKRYLSNDTKYLWAAMKYALDKYYIKTFKIIFKLCDKRDKIVMNELKKEKHRLTMVIINNAKNAINRL